jgi:small subunit ribosomal protein S6
MNYYESLYIIHPALESGRLKDIILSIQSMFEGKDIKVLGTDLWGKKKLAYLIDKQRYGTYVLVQLQSSGENINKISTELEHNPDILAYLTSKIDESDLQKDLRSLDDQILGSKSLDPENVNTNNSKSEAKSSDSDTSKEASDSDTSEEASTNNNEKSTSEENNGTNK